MGEMGSDRVDCENKAQRDGGRIEGPPPTWIRLTGCAGQGKLTEALGEIQLHLLLRTDTIRQ